MRRLVLLAVAVLGLAACGGSGTLRPSGVTERWLQAVSDAGREGVADDAAAKAERYGSLAAAGDLLDAPFEDDDSRFTDLEVGAADVSGDRARVPLRVTRRLEGGATDEVFVTALLERGGDTWSVTGLDESGDDELVPSRGGDRPASATARHWLAAVAFGALAAVASALVIEAQPAVPAVRQQARSQYVPAAPKRP